MNRPDGLAVGALGQEETLRRLFELADDQDAAMEVLTAGYTRIAAVRTVLETVGVDTTQGNGSHFELRDPRTTAFDFRFSQIFDDLRQAGALPRPPPPPTVGNAACH